jgi:hypothetical protein
MSKQQWYAAAVHADGTYVLGKPRRSEGGAVALAEKLDHARIVAVQATSVAEAREAVDLVLTAPTVEPTEAELREAADAKLARSRVRSDVVAPAPLWWAAIYDAGGGAPFVGEEGYATVEEAKDAADRLALDFVDAMVPGSEHVIEALDRAEAEAIALAADGVVPEAPVRRAVRGRRAYVPPDQRPRWWSAFLVDGELHVDDDVPYVHLNAALRRTQWLVEQDRYQSPGAVVQAMTRDEALERLREHGDFPAEPLAAETAGV